MIRTLLVLLMMLPAACTSAGKRADQEVAMLKANDGTPRQICAAARRAADAYSHDQDADGFKYAQIAMQAECSTVEVFPGYADTPGGVPKPSDEDIARRLAQLPAEKR